MVAKGVAFARSSATFLHSCRIGNKFLLICGFLWRVDVHFSDIVLGLIALHQAGKDGTVKGGKIDVTVTSVEEADAMKRKEKWKKEKEVLYLAGLSCSSLGFYFL